MGKIKLGVCVATIIALAVAIGDPPQEHEQPRSSKWPAVEREHLKREPACAVCGHTGKGLNVHHVLPFHKDPKLELDDSNLITLCGEEGRCKAHYWLGHCGEWKGWNPDVRKDAVLMRSRWQRSAKLAKE